MDFEDYDQFRKMCILSGMPIEKACRISERIRQRDKRRAARNKELVNTIEYKEYNNDSPLLAIVDPNSNRLAELPAYFRFVAYILSKGVRKAPSALGTSRMSLYRWILKHKMLPTYRVVSYTKRRAYKPQGKLSD